MTVWPILYWLTVGAAFVGACAVLFLAARMLRNDMREDQSEGGK